MGQQRQVLVIRAFQQLLHRLDGNALISYLSSAKENEHNPPA